MKTLRTRSGAKASGIRRQNIAQETSEGFPRAAFDALGIGVALLDEHGIVLAVNRTWGNFQTCDPTRAMFCGVGDNFLDACRAATVDPTLDHPLADGIRAVASGHTPVFCLEYSQPVSAGKHWYQGRVTRFDDAGSLRIVVSCEDITARRQAEAGQRWRQMFLEAQANSSLDGILVVDSLGKMILQNQRFVDIWKVPRSIAEASDDKERLRWVASMTKDPAGFVQKVSHLYAHPKAKSRDEIALKDGTYLDRYSAPVLGADGTLYGRIWTFRDITERKRMEESLREGEARFQRITDNVPGMVYRFVLQTDGQIVLPFVSEGARKIYGLDPHAVMQDSRLILDRVHPDDRAEHDRSIDVSAASLAPWKWQGRILRADNGEVRHVQGASQPELQPNGDILWDGVLMDVTEIKQAEEHRRAKDEAERMNDAKSEFLSRMSHELRTPLNAILGFGQVLELSPLGEQDEHCVQYILKGGRHLLSLVDEVLDLTRVEKGELSFNLTAFSMGRLVQECVGLVSKMAQERGIFCTFADGAGCQVLVRADELRLRQVLLNLLSNAIKYNRKGGRVRVNCRALPEGMVRCQVEDNGEGIPPEGLARLFVPFERLGKELGGAAGTGLGLVVSKRLAEAMGGRLGVESQVQAGSTFWIDLPAAVSTEMVTAGECAPEPAAASDGGAASTATVLYIEDNLSNLQVMETVAQRLRPGWRFLSAADGIEGLRLVRDQRPDAVLLDLQIPGLAGDAVLAALRADPAMARLPVLLLSADATPQSRDRHMALGANGYMTKPFNLAELVEQIDTLLLIR